MSLLVPISIGELWDKYSILLIKQEKIKDEYKIIQINLEIEFLNEIMKKYSYEEDSLFLKLKKVNEELWEIEDKLRIKENIKCFDDDFIKLARLVYYTNDDRAEIKKQINIKFNSIINEIKDYIIYK